MTDFYQSPADKLRFEILLKSLREGSLNLAIVGDDEVALASYGRQIYDHLIQAGEEHVEWWSSADSEKLVQRFNDILSELTVDEALDKSQKRSPKRYMIFPDTHAIQDFELQLLARLINGFPTSNINLVLVVNQLDPYEEKLAVFGKNLLQWILESELPPSARAPKRSNRIETMDETPQVLPEAPQAVKQDAIADFSATFAATLASGKFPGPGQSKLPTPDIGDVSPSDKEEFDPLNASPGQRDLNKQPDSELESTSTFSSRVAGILIVAIVLTVSAFGLIYKDEVAQEAQSLQDFAAGKKPATAKTAAPPKVAQPNPTDPALPTVPPAAGPTPAAGVDPQSNTQPNPSNPASTGSPAVQGTAPTPTPGPTAQLPATAATGTPTTLAKTPAQTPAQTPSAPPSGVGMSSSVKVPVKTDDSLIPNKEVLIAPKVPGSAPTPAPNSTLPGSGAALTPTPATPASTANPSSSPLKAGQAVNSGSLQTPASVVAPVTPSSAQAVAVGPKAAPQTAPNVAGTAGNAPTKVDVKAEVKAEAKAEAKVEPKADLKISTKPDLREAKPNTRDLPKEIPKETRDQREPREVKQIAKTPALKTPVAKTNEPLPKLDPKADKAEKTEESKPKSASPESSSGFKPRAEDQRWVQGLPEDAWVMQHAALDSFEEAKSFQQSSPFYRDAKVMYTKRKEAPPYYIVVTGPYTSRQEAESETRKHPIMAKSWVRSARSLKNQFED